MVTAQFQLSERKPLQPKNTAATGNDNIAVVSKESSNNKQTKSKPKEERMGMEILEVGDSNKENLNLIHYPIPNPKYATPTKKMGVEALDLDSSLAEELSAIRKKLERLRLDKEKTEKMLKERDALLHFQKKQLEDRGQIQKQLEIEVDRLFRLKELKSYCMRISPIKSLRERQEEDRRISGGKTLELEAADSEAESVHENTLQSPTPSDSSEFVRENSED